MLWRWRLQPAPCCCARPPSFWFCIRFIRWRAISRRLPQGNLEHRVEWTSRDDFGVIASELNRIAVRLRDLRDTEAGPQADGVSAFRRRVAIDLRADHRDRRQGARAEGEPGRGGAAGRRLRPTAWRWPTTPGGDKILSAIRDAVSMQKAVAAEDEAAMLPMRIGKQERSYRLRTTPMRDSEGRLLGTVTTLEDVTSLQDTDRFKTQFIAVASRKLRDPLLQLRRGLYALGQGFGGRDGAAADRAGGCGQQGVGEAERPDDRPDRSGGARHRQARTEARADAPAAGADRGARPLLRRGRRRSTSAWR